MAYTGVLPVKRGDRVAIGPLLMPLAAQFLRSSGRGARSIFSCLFLLQEMRIFSDSRSVSPASRFTAAQTAQRMPHRELYELELSSLDLSDHAMADSATKGEKHSRTEELLEALMLRMEPMDQVIATLRAQPVTSSEQAVRPKWASVPLRKHFPRPKEGSREEERQREKDGIV
ncbi:hypothetical protein NDU88_002696 [Pleurodeles waltl]|uniref:Uncharacterized protein n=1 Tax=Pleurodeles waltl TaxID=8319 RepID=A0AAV7QAM1_PLEWA|nr:hypothetical protein NDU88_002696 [Pleurodeles waltl]